MLRKNKNSQLADSPDTQTLSSGNSKTWRKIKAGAAGGAALLAVACESPLSSSHAEPQSGEAIVTAIEDAPRGSVLRPEPGIITVDAGVAIRSGYEPSKTEDGEATDPRNVITRLKKRTIFKKPGFVKVTKEPTDPDAISDIADSDPANTRATAFVVEIPGKKGMYGYIIGSAFVDPSGEGKTEAQQDLNGVTLQEQVATESTPITTDPRTGALEANGQPIGVAQSTE